MQLPQKVAVELPFFTMTLLRHERAWKLLQDTKRLLKRTKALIPAELLELEQAIKKRTISGSDALKQAHALKRRTKKQRTFLRSCIEGTIGLVIALLFATVIRTIWFELYEIPTGSMRPTYQEGDRLIGTKTSFGVNIPLVTDHFYFDPHLIHRDQIVIFSLDNMNARDPDAVYFWLFKGKKMLIKRLIGKPGDTLYFYGGRVWIVDQEGHFIRPTSKVEHVPYISFEGREGVQSGVHVSTLPFWAGDFIGMKNYAEAKLIDSSHLQIAHFPDTDRTLLLGSHTFLRPYISEITLTQEQLLTIATHMSTARFVVRDGRASRSDILDRSVSLAGIPDGTYQFIDGQAQEIDFAGIIHNLPKTHPLYNHKLIKTLFNEGFDFIGLYAPASPFFPQRFVYFTDGQLMLAGHPLLSKEESTAFIAQENRKASNYYRPFIDEGEPTKERVLQYGVKVPDHSYYVLGDNFPMSADSRDFGFVPQGNIRGAPGFLFWPPGDRFGPPSTTADWITLPHMILWLGLGLAVVITWRCYYRIPK